MASHEWRLYGIEQIKKLHLFTLQYQYVADFGLSHIEQTREEEKQKIITKIEGVPVERFSTFQRH